MLVRYYIKYCNKCRSRYCNNTAVGGIIGIVVDTAIDTVVVV